MPVNGLSQPYSRASAKLENRYSSPNRPTKPIFCHSSHAKAKFMVAFIFVLKSKRQTKPASKPFVPTSARTEKPVAKESNHSTRAETPIVPGNPVLNSPVPKSPTPVRLAPKANFWADAAPEKHSISNKTRRQKEKRIKPRLLETNEKPSRNTPFDLVAWLAFDKLGNWCYIHAALERVCFFARRSKRSRSSVVEHPLGKGEVVGSIPTASSSI